MNKITLKKFNENKSVNLGLSIAVIFIVIFLVLISGVKTKTYKLNEGDICGENIKAERDIVDKITTEEKKKEAANKVENQVIYNENVKLETTNQIDTFFSQINAVDREASELVQKEATTKEVGETTDKDEEDRIYNEKLLNKKVELIKKKGGVQLSDEDYKKILVLTPKELNELRDYIINIMDKLYDDVKLYQRYYEANKENYNVIKKENEVDAQQYLEVEVNKSTLPSNLKELSKAVTFKIIKPNYIYDKKATELKKEEARSSVEDVVIRKGQFIVKEGEKVTESQIEVLKETGILDENKKSIWATYFSLALFIIIVLALQGYYLHKYHEKIFKDYRKLILLGVITCMFLILARTIAMINAYLIPLAFAPMIIAMLLNDTSAMVISIINALLVGVATQLQLDIVILTILNSIAGVMLLKNVEQRNDILYSSMYIGIINGIAIGSIQFIQGGYEGTTIILNSLLAFLGSMLSGILTIGFLPVFESVFDIVTNVKLLELSNPNHPLLRKLSMEAPGTYHHSVLVANLSELAAQSIGANSILARVAAYYHDIGKTKRPYFFKENQRAENPHDKISPNLSTLIIISHIKDGIEMAKEYKLPKEITDIIQQHHGNTLVKYFYITMKNNSPKPEEIKEEDFRYSGPVPSTKEAGIVMLADSVEAAVRSISDPTKGKIEEMVNNIIKGKLNDGQLDNCDLTLKDLNNIREAFLQGLSGIYHERIEYPKLVNKN